MKNRFLVSCIISIWISGVISVVTVPSASASDDVRVAVMGAVGVRTERATMPYDLPDSGALDGKTVTSIDAGNSATCVVASGEIFCWGDSYTNGTSQNSSTPVAINTSGVLKGKIISSVSVGGNFACALASGAVFCWGVNNVGQLGNSSTEYSTTPVSVTATGVLAGKLVMSISLGSAHACMLVAGSIYCWGSNLSNQLGTKSNLGTLNYSTTPVPTESSGALLGKTVTAVSSGNSHTCALASGQVFCWGENSSSQLGDGTNSWSAVPVMVNTTGAMTGKTVTAISAGQSHTCAIASGAAFCWGYGSSGQLGNGSVNYSNPQPTAVVSTGVLAGKTLSSINSGVSSTCAIASGAAFCWGWGGALGNNSSVISSVPVAVDTGLVKPGLTYEVSVGAGHTCALTSGTANCWGQAESGQLGNNSFNNSLVPTPVVTKATLSGKTIDSISSSNSHTCVTAVGKAFCWGQGNAGQLGNGSNRNSATPVEVSTTGALVGKSITAISTGSQHTCAIAAGSAFCWGQNREGQLGNGTKVASPVPVAVDASGVLAGKVITSIYAGGSFSCAIASGQVYCWGSNAGGQIGVEVAKDFFGAYVQVSFLTPVAVDTKGVLKGKIISSFAFHSQGSTVSVLSDKRVYSWGGSARTPIENSVTNSGDLKDQDIIQASGGFYSELYGCIMTSNGVYCSDEISRETTTKPVKINTESTLGGRPISQVFSNGQNSCVISVGSLYCWGQNENGQLGNHSVKNSAIPVPVETSETLKDREVLAVTFSGSVTYVLHRAMSAEAKAAAEKAAVEEVTKAKTAAEKAAADAADALRAELQAKAKAKAEAEAAAKARTAAEIKAANEAKAAAKAKADAEANAKAEAESALVRAINDLKSATATIAKLNDSNAELNRIISSLSASNKNQQDQINALNARINELLTPKPTTIVCAKGTTTKTVKGINPVCPAGYKKK